jgi:ribosomal protein L37AE/L43A
MHIKEILSQHRRDFRAVYRCEHCGHEVEKGGYDDTNYHCNVVPDMACGNCGKKAGEGFRPRHPVHPDIATV